MNNNIENRQPPRATELQYLEGFRERTIACLERNTYGGLTYDLYKGDVAAGCWAGFDNKNRVMSQENAVLTQITNRSRDILNGIKTMIEGGIGGENGRLKSTIVFRSIGANQHISIESVDRFRQEGAEYYRHNFAAAVTPYDADFFSPPAQLFHPHALFFCGGTTISNLESENKEEAPRAALRATLYNWSRLVGYRGYLLFTVDTYSPEHYDITAAKEAYRDPAFVPVYYDLVDRWNTKLGVTGITRNDIEVDFRVADQFVIQHALVAKKDLHTISVPSLYGSEHIDVSSIYEGESIVPLNATKWPISEIDAAISDVNIKLKGDDSSLTLADRVIGMNKRTVAHLVKVGDGGAGLRTNAIG